MAYTFTTSLDPLSPYTVAVTVYIPPVPATVADPYIW